MVTRAKHREYQRTYRARHPERVRATKARWRASNPMSVRASNLRNGHQMTPAEYDAMLATQGGVCAVCAGQETKRHGSGTPFSLAVDHDHLTGVVRGLLCSDCNRALGLLRDDPMRAAALVHYLQHGVKG